MASILTVLPGAASDLPQPTVVDAIITAIEVSVVVTVVAVSTALLSHEPSVVVIVLSS